MHASKQINVARIEALTKRSVFATLVRMLQRVLFCVLFSTIGLVTLHIPFTKLAGSNVSFTLFDFFGPIAGAFLGPFFGVFSVLTVELVNLVISQTPVNIGTIIRLFPMLFAVYFFAVVSKKQGSAYILAVPVLAIVVFLAHPIGQTVWYYSLFWLIPLIAYWKRDLLLARSLGATFTAHAVGGAAWIWAFNLPASVWSSLIPVVIGERALFTLGISASFIVMKYTLSFLAAKKLLPSIEQLNPQRS